MLEGQQSYVPTRLEWLALLLNVHNPRTLEPQIHVNFIADNSANAILVTIAHDPNVDRKILRATVDMCKRVVLEIAEGHGWLSWLNVKVQIERK